MVLFETQLTLAFTRCEWSWLLQNAYPGWAVFRSRSMQGKKPFLDKEVIRFRLTERVPPHNLYRRLAELVDWTFLYDETRALYSHTGQPSLDPVVFFKLVLVGRLENLVSDRRLIEHCALLLDILLFLGYEVAEELPWH